MTATVVRGTPTAPPPIEIAPIMSRGVGGRCQHIYRFGNGMGASVVPIQHGLMWEAATLRFTGDAPDAFELVRDDTGEAAISFELFEGELVALLVEIAGAAS